MEMGRTAFSLASPSTPKPDSTQGLMESNGRLFVELTPLPISQFGYPFEENLGQVNDSSKPSHAISDDSRPTISMTQIKFPLEASLYLNTWK